MKKLLLCLLFPLLFSCCSKEDIFLSATDTTPIKSITYYNDAIVRSVETMTYNGENQLIRIDGLKNYSRYKLIEYNEEGLPRLVEEYAINPFEKLVTKEEFIYDKKNRLIGIDTRYYNKPNPSTFAFHRFTLDNRGRRKRIDVEQGNSKRYYLLVWKGEELRELKFYDDDDVLINEIHFTYDTASNPFRSLPTHQKETYLLSEHNVKDYKLVAGDLWFSTRCDETGTCRVEYKYDSEDFPVEINYPWENGKWEVEYE